MEHTSSTVTNNNWYYQSFFADTNYHYLYLSAILVTLFNRSKSDLRIKLLQNGSRIYFHFYSQTYKIETT